MRFILATLFSCTCATKRMTTTSITKSLTCFDAHSHLHFANERGTAYIASDTTRGFGLCATRPEDWSNVVALRDAFPSRVFASVGVHPYWAHLYTSATVLPQLRERIHGDERLLVGEIGIDKHWVTRETGVNEFDKQCELFEPQFDLAAELKRPVVIHCVRAHGYLCDFLRSRTELCPPSIYMHAYGGSVEIATQLIKMLRGKVYFGFAASVNMRNEERLRELIGNIPLEFLLLESDAEVPDRVEEDIEHLAHLIADVKGITTQEVYSTTKDNTEVFLRRASKQFQEKSGHVFERKKTRILAFGDSLTAGYSKGGRLFHPYNIKLQELFGIDIEDEDDESYIHERGISGEETFSMVRRLQGILSKDLTYDVVCILGGTNDLRFFETETDAELFSRLQALYDHVLSKGSKLLVITIPDAFMVHELFNKSDAKRYIDHRTKVNSRIRDFSSSQSSERVRCLDLERLMPTVSASGERDTDFWDTDGLHMTQRGYDRFGELVFEAIKDM